ncbi:MAG: FHA domain-containing protein [Planctomycetaceae bacterium]|nr:FHA domain-containing protein [Planctomycetaceae bacterium]MCA9045797.1 FHA domain-containing protein [Planctomycetaceae bacterium]
MGELTFQVIDGLEAGAVFGDLASPVTIGREEDNKIRLNDERISRFHAKIQETEGRVILTDLESTNGTRVNGHPVRMRVLSIGDQIHVGRCVLVYGSQQQIDEKIINEEDSSDNSKRIDTDIRNRDQAHVFPDAYPGGPPEIPEGLTPLQAVELANVLDFVRTEVLSALYKCHEPVVRDGVNQVNLPNAAWHRLQRVPLQLAQYLKKLSEPHSEAGHGTVEDENT